MSTILVTVGTTQFDELVMAVDRKEFLAAAARKGYKKLVVQRGNGKYQPTLITSGSAEGLQIECFDYRPNLAGTMAAADLVISHAGAGSIFEALSSKKNLIVVPNERLMHNHQVELAEHLTKLQYLVYSKPANLPSTLESFDASKLKSYQKGNAEKVAAYISEQLGLTPAS